MHMMTRMLRLLFVGLLLTISFSGFAQNSIYGDVNGDGEVNIADVNAVVRVILGESQIDNGIVGTWISEYGVDSYGRYDILENDIVSFVFNEDHTGRYTFYTNQGMAYVDLDWETRGDRLYIRYYEGDTENLYYRIDESGYLLLALDAQFTIYTAYRPVTESDMSSTGTSKDSHPSQSASASRAIKGR
jgi:hypothetical protein